MNTRRVNGLEFEKMMKASLACLYAEEQRLNDLNVFPVPDGDTGTNMRRTVEAGIIAAESRESAEEYVKSLSSGMLMGARGNSGVILSQFFRGMAISLSREPLIGIGEFRNALITGYRTAYASVVKPVEGTMLTVAREGIENVRRSLTRHTDIGTLLSMYVAEMKNSLKRTPELLPELKDAGVVDSGGAGLIVIFEGMLKYLYGEKLPEIPENTKKAAPRTAQAGFNEYSSFDDGYCMEFVLQLMKSGGYDRRFILDNFRADLGLYGTSIVAVQDGSKVKVHVHTHRPSKVISLCEDFGVFVDFKLENMQIQHNERDMNVISGQKKPLGIIAVVNGEGIRRQFEAAGCTVIDGGPTMNTSTGEFAEAFSRMNAERIAVLPDSSNVIPAAEQAAKAFGPNVTVIPTKSIVQGYFALMMDVADSKDTDYRINQMLSGASGVTSLAQTTATRNCVFREISCRSGDEILLTDGELSAVGEDSIRCILSGFGAIPDIEDRESFVLFRGSGTSEEDGDELLRALGEKYPLMDCEIIDGGQETYRWLIGIC